MPDVIFPFSRLDLYRILMKRSRSETSIRSVECFEDGVRWNKTEIA